MLEEADIEAHVSAEQPPPGEAPRVPPSHVDASRPAHPPEPSPEGPAPPVGVIWRIRDRSTFAELRRRGRRVRQGPVTVTFLPETNAGSRAEPPKVAYAVGRRVGPAVRRNRVRRQLRSIMRELVARPERVVPPGAYLISAQPGITALSYRELRSNVEAAMDQIGAMQGAGRP